MPQILGIEIRTLIVYSSIIRSQRVRQMKRVVIFAIVTVFLIIAVLTTVFITNSPTKSGAVNPDIQPFYVGVTFGGNITADAKLLIDKVKDYTNLFILQSGPIQNNISAIYEIGDYAVNSGLNLILYFGTDSAWLMKEWFDTYDGQWNTSFLGVYFGDEAGGKMLDNEMAFYNEGTQSSFRKMADGTITNFIINKETVVTYKPDGTIITTAFANQSPFPESRSFITYYPNGTRTITTQGIKNAQSIVEHVFNTTHTYEELWNARPLRTHDETAQRFINEIKSAINRAKAYGLRSNYTILTSDYVLYWFDYGGGYDTVLAQLGWNHTTTQDIALVRGAARMQNRSWGTIITWKYDKSPYLANGQEIYDQMKVSYEAGAKYVVIFNYAEDMEGYYGTLKEEHFDALERFWNNVVQNPLVVNGEIEAEAVLVLPKNYGWGMRNPEDTVWGLWQPSPEYQQIWQLLQETLFKHGTKLDIIYDDPEFPAQGKYSTIYYWNREVCTIKFLIDSTLIVILRAVWG